MSHLSVASKRPNHWATKPNPKSFQFGGDKIDMMQTITQRSKKAKYIIAGLVIVIVIVAIIGLLSVLKNVDGNPYINLTPVADGFVAIYRDWSGVTLTNAILTSLGWIALGAFVMFLYFKARGEKVTTTANTQPGYSPVPSYPSQAPQSGKETTIS